jgi:GT2 family glycosyltransferase
MRKKMTEAKVAFIVLTWNSKKYIQTCLESILRLRFLATNIFVIDNGSTDGTLSIIDSVMETHSNVSLVRLHKNFGTTISRNMGIRRVSSDTDYVCILDSDTVVNQEAFSELTQCLQEDSAQSIGIVGPRMRSGSGELQLSARNLPTLWIKVLKIVPIPSIRKLGERMEIPESLDRGRLTDVGYLLSACWFMPITTIKSTGLLDEAIFYAPEDVDYCLRVHNQHLRVVFCNSAEIVHDYQRISRKKLFSLSNYNHIKGLAYFFTKHHYLFKAPNWSK